MSDSSAATAPVVTTVDLSQAKPATTPKVPEAPQAPKAPENKPDDKFASKFAALDRKSKEIRERENKWKTEAETIKAEAAKAREEAAQIRDKYGRFMSLEETLKNDKKAGLKWLMEQGATPEELSDALLEELNPDPQRKLERSTSEIEKRLMERIAALEGKLTAKEQEELDRQKKAEQDKFEKTVTQVKSELREFIDASEDYELIKLSGEYETVFEVMQEHYNDQVARKVDPKDIKVLSYEEAAKWTESYLEEDARKKYEAKHARLAAKQNTPAKPKMTSPTLSNTLSTEVQNSEEPKPKSREESLKRAARLLRYTEE